jgi:hypothetical protein
MVANILPNVFQEGAVLNTDLKNVMCVQFKCIWKQAHTYPVNSNYKFGQ